MNRGQRMFAAETPPVLSRAADAASPRPNCRPMRGAFLRAAALLLVLVSCPAFASAGENPLKADGAVHLQRGEDAPADASDARGVYIFRVGSILRSHWRIMTMSKTVTGVRLRVDSRGTITDVRIVAPSGSAAADESVLRAVRATRQVPPPPAGVDGTLLLNFIVP